MPVKKQRIDKYYHMAKDKGYRARSAFKLLELNRKYSFLQNARVAVDLCAAPGGWLQILAQEMPAVRKIIGVDLDPIKPLGGDTVTFIGDITTVECRKTLIGLLDGNQVDIFVHDGAPNFGSSKERDVFLQNDLVLSALKLTSEFLKEGGTFVTKIFRSENFSRILSVLEELFGQVDVTKPLSSRSESAEVFAVCRKYKAPEFIDPSFFNFNILFREEQCNTGDYLKIKLSEYILSQSEDILDRCLQIVPDFTSPLITEEIKEMFTDIKLLSVSDLKRIKRLKNTVIKQVENGILDVPSLSSLKKEVVGVSAEQVPELSKTEKIKEALKKMEKQKKKEKEAERTIYEFFNDRIFCDFDSTEEPEDFNEEQPDSVEVDSCSTEVEMDEEEMRCAIAMKERGDEFVEDTIDRYLVAEDDVVLPFEKRPVKFDEPKVEKKKAEFLGRKRARAMRRAKKVMSDVMVEEEEEEAVIYKKVFKNMYKKERKKARLVFPRRGDSKVIAPRGKGRVKLLDRRMKHDLLIERKRAKQKK